MLVRHEPDGLPAGELARALGVPANTLSAHLAILSHAGLVAGERDGRSVIYRARLERVRALTLFLLKDCCGGREELCAPLLAELAPCC
ncbi:DNA-binding transcriptional ArsR family regulator [Rubellimicrobium aerolatum]|nr:DNA-binding transcriptional ArsR family regulator [Rubellimicrobium aerolatum]